MIPKTHIRTIKDLDGGDVPLCNVDVIFGSENFIKKRFFLSFIIVQEMIDLGKSLLKEQGFNPDDDSQIR